MDRPEISTLLHLMYLQPGMRSLLFAAGGWFGWNRSWAETGSVAAQSCEPGGEWGASLRVVGQDWLQSGRACRCCSGAPPRMRLHGQMPRRIISWLTAPRPANGLIYCIVGTVFNKEPTSVGVLLQTGLVMESWPIQAVIESLQVVYEGMSVQ